MQPLEKTLRSRLEKTVKEARDVAESAALAALNQLGVGQAKPDGYFSEEEKALRRRLRVHGRQLGDRRDPKGEQEISRLIEEVAYEHWHRMLFARFLAENNLLMYPDPDDPVAITLEECEDLAADEGAANGWELAARYAARMLPQIFRLDSPVFQLTLPPEHQQKLEHLVTDLPLEVFTASDSLGWVYQFWQAKRKDEVNKSEVKIGARELPAVTQLFTEPYMVSFLLDNALGAWWAARRLTEADLKNASSEEELRNKASLPGVPLEYLRFVQIEDDAGDTQWQPAAGAFDAWPEQLGDLKTLDPCCGSGHFLVAAFLMLVPMRMELEGLSAHEVVDAVLRENLHGLEIDQRCVELAAFALALTAWKYPNLPSPSGRGVGGEGAIGYRPLPELNLACSGLSVSVAKEEWKQLGLGKKNLTIALDWMHDTFKDAPVLGSLLNPAKTDAAKLVHWDEFSQTLEHALSLSSPSGRGAGGEGCEQQEATVVAQGLAKAATLLAGQYQWVITNVPYLARGKQNQRLREFCERHYPAAKNDLATVFLDRCLEFCSLLSPSGRGAGGEGAIGGTVSVVLPQNWLFLTSYKKFREKLLQQDTWHLIARLGEGGFDSSAAAGAFVAMINLSRGGSVQQAEGLFAERADGHLIRGMDVSEPRTAAEKAAGLLTTEIKSVEQAKQLDNPDAVIVFQIIDADFLLSKVATINYGSKPGQTDRVIRYHWELFGITVKWQLLESTPSSLGHYSGKEKICLTLDEVEKQGITQFGIRSADIWGKNGIIQSQIREMPYSIYCGMLFDNNTSVLVKDEVNYLPSLFSFIKSGAYLSAVRKLNQKLDVAAHTMVKVPFDLDHWTKVAEEKYPNGLPKPYSNDPTQWIFHGHPYGSVVWDEKTKWTAHGSLRTDDTVLQVAVARLLGYRWPAEQDTEMELADEQREWVNRCETLLPFADEDGIVCIPPVRGEAAAADRLLNLLAAAYNLHPSPSGRGAGGEGWSNDILAELLKNASHAGKSLETWLRDKFFAQHCKLFQNRPFIWHIWDGLRDGFSVLINYHKFDAKLMESLIYLYLGDWITRQKQDIAAGIDGAEEKLAAAENLKKKLELIKKGEAPHDIFVRWKPLQEQPIGWNPDLNDGVRLNIRPFMTVGNVKKKGAGILHDKPNIKWNKDRGKDVETAPWYHLGPEYGGKEGDRINDHHLTLAEKLTARKNIE